MNTISWPEFSILFAAALIGGAAILPYSVRLLKQSGEIKPLKMSVSKLLLLSFIQTAVLSAAAIGIGLLAAHRIGLGAPYIEAALQGNGSMQTVALMLRTAIPLGFLGGLILLLMDVLFLPHLPEVLLDTARKTSLWESFTASFYGGLNEEFLMRLFGLSVLAWMLSRIWHTSADLPEHRLLDRECDHGNSFRARAPACSQKSFRPDSAPHAHSDAFAQRSDRTYLRLALLGLRD